LYGEQVLSITPGGWINDDEGEMEVSRNITYRGLFRLTSVSELIFYKKGADFIQTIIENYDIVPDIYLKVEWFNPQTFAYEDYPGTPFILDLTTYERDEVGVHIQLLDNDFYEKVKNRDSIDVDVTDRKSIGGYSIAQFTGFESTGVPLLTMGSTSDTLVATFNINGSGIPTTATHILPIREDESQFPETQTPTNDPGTKDGSFFESSSRDRTLDISGNIQGNVNSTSGLPVTEIDITVYLVVIDSDESETQRFELWSHVEANTTGFTWDENISQSVTINTGDSVSIEVILLPFSSAVDWTHTACDIECDEDYTGLTEKTIFAWPVYEAFLRILQKICDSANPLYSTFFGRTDTELTTYVSDGEICHITRGIAYRKGKQTVTLPLSFKSLFKTMSSIYNLGMTVEEISGEQKVVIEHISYFFEDSEGLDLSDRIREANIVKKCLPDLYFNEIDVGYKKFEYESNYGLLEFNVKSVFSTILSKIKKTLDIVADYRADSMGMSLLLTSTEDWTTDVKGDEDIFVIKSKRDGSGGFITELDENFRFVGGGIWAGKNYNLEWSPKRNLLRWGSVIKAGLLKSLNTYLRFQSSEKDSNLVTEKPTETALLYETGDVLVDDLDTPIWNNDGYEIDTYLTNDEIQTILDDPKKYITLSSTKSGWIERMRINKWNRKVTLELRKRDVG